MDASTRRLPPETWGQRLARARGRVSLSAIESQLPGYVSRSTLNRLEHCDSTPAEPAQRRRAALVVTLLGFDLGDFGLSEADLPPFVSRAQVADLLAHASRRTGWLIENRVERDPAPSGTLGPAGHLAA